MTPLPLIYIAGPFRGPTPLAVRRNVEAARDLGLRVAEAGGYPVIPHTMTSEFDKLLTDEFWLQGTMEMLRRCDGIVLSPTWESSSGARAEHDAAREMHMPLHRYGVAWPGGNFPQAWDRELARFVEEVRENMRRLAANFNHV